MEIIDFETTARRLQEMGIIESLPDDKRVYIRLQNAKDILQRGMNWATSGNCKWQPEYDKIVDWLTDNHGRGLLMYGQCGRGKSLLGMYVLPTILNYWCHKIVNCVNAQQMNQQADELLSKHIIYIDDVGTESVSNQYGNKRTVFPEIVDAAERHGKLLIISTNLSLLQLQQQYGDRIADRLKAITTQVLFKGNSLRV